MVQTDNTKNSLLGQLTCLKILTSRHLHCFTSLQDAALETSCSHDITRLWGSCRCPRVGQGTMRFGCIRKAHAEVPKHLTVQALMWTLCCAPPFPFLSMQLASMGLPSHLMIPDRLIHHGVSSQTLPAERGVIYLDSDLCTCRRPASLRQPLPPRRSPPT